MAVKVAPPGEVTLRLHDPGMTPMHRAGLGGLAATLGRLENEGRLPDAGSADVSSDRIRLRWTPGEARAFFEPLFERSFRIHEGLIHLPGAWSGLLPPLPVRVVQQDALRSTFLQHGKAAKKIGAPALVSLEVDSDQVVSVNKQEYSEFAHQGMGAQIATELDRPAGKQRTLSLASWAYPGAVQRHVAFGATQVDYSVEQAISILFAIVGCVSKLWGGGGVLLIPQPRDLRRFAAVRGDLMAPSTVTDVYAGGIGDAVMTLESALYADQLTTDAPEAVDGVHGVLLRSTPWASQQKSRVAVVQVSDVEDAILDGWVTASRALPPRVIPVKAKKGEPSPSWIKPSGLRSFMGDNIAHGRRWYAGFTQAKHPIDTDRFIHYAYASDNKGALWPSELEGLRSMIEDALEEAEHTLVSSVHTALRQRLGMIAEENQTNEHARNKRWEREREKWRLAFAGAKTREQVRFSLADLWSRAGNVAELRDAWPKVLPLLRDPHWRAARDLALIALASYQGRKPVEVSKEVE